MLLLIHCLLFAPIVCGGVVFGPCFFPVLCPSSAAITCMGNESWLLYFNCVPEVLWLLVFCRSSSRYHMLVCSVGLWYFLFILTCFLK